MHGLPSECWAMPDCPCRDMDALAHALTVVEAALATASERNEILRSQLRRLQYITGSAPAMRITEIAQRAGVGYTTVQQWAQRYPDWPQANGGYYDRHDIEGFLERHPRLDHRQGSTPLTGPTEPPTRWEY
jgi:hypothetical protein